MSIFIIVIRTPPEQLGAMSDSGSSKKDVTQEETSCMLYFSFSGRRGAKPFAVVDLHSTPGAPLWCIPTAPTAVQPVFNFKYHSSPEETPGESMATTSKQHCYWLAGEN